MRQDKFKEIVMPLIDRLFRLAFHVTGTKEDAEDVVQDALFHIWKKKENWDAIENLEAYCFRSVRNIALNKLALNDNKTESLQVHFDQPDSGENIQKKLEEKEYLAELDEWVKKLPEKQRTIFVLREIEEMSYKEIAGILKITEEQVKISLFRSRKKLKLYFEEFKNE